MSHKSKRLEAMDPMTNHDNPHNNYLYVLASFGIFGLAAYLWLLWRLLSQAFRRFLAIPQRLLEKGKNGELAPGVVTAWELVDDPEKPRLFLSTSKSKEVAELINDAELGLRASSEPGRVIVTGFASGSSPAEKIAELQLPVMYNRTERTLAFGVVTSFFSYAFYSIAGFDSVACSVFFYFLLGCAAVFLEPCSDEAPRPLGVNILRHLAELRGREPGSVKNEIPLALSIGLAALGVILLGHTIHGGIKVNAAEQAFVGLRVRSRTALEQMERKISNIKHAIEINPNESFYKQSLGNAFSDAARVLRAEANQMARQGQTQEAQERLLKAQKYSEKAEVALYAALDHAWAPENVFISAFQVFYQDRRPDKAEQALERALEHSPHLGAVRANLAILKLERGAWDEALADCEWVLEVDKKSAVAWRTCGRAYFMKNDLKKAEAYLKKAALLSKGDTVVKEYLKELEAKKAAPTSTKS
jgi:tetratricopeptide (TPR) repeat protein